MMNFNELILIGKLPGLKRFFGKFFRLFRMKIEICFVFPGQEFLGFFSTIFENFVSKPTGLKFALIAKS